MENQYTGSAVGHPAPDHRAPDRPIAASRSGGFTLLELIMTMAVAAILLMIAVPSFQYVTNANRLSSEINGLLGDLQFARAEAIKEGQDVTVCVSADGATCSGGAWQGGWIVFSDPTGVQAGGTALRVQSPFSSTDTFVGDNGLNPLSAITFNRNGYAIGIVNGAIITLHDATNNAAWTRCASVAMSGQVTTEMSGVTSNGATCT